MATIGETRYILTIFGCISAILEDFLTKKEKTHKSLKLCLVDTLGQRGLCFFHFQSGNASKFKKKLTFIPKIHILATRGEKRYILTIFGRILAILEDFLTEKEKNT